MTLLRAVPGVARPAEGRLVDRFAREHTYLRVSVTDRCNLRCTYCMPEDGVTWKPREDLLTYEEIATLVRVFVGMGIRRVRLTGGEPLLRRDIVALVGQLGAMGVDDLAMTTNAVLLGRHAEALKQAGLDRVNVSCDSADPEVFHQLTRGGDLARVLEGIEAARRAGLTPIKINAVAMAGHDAEVVPLVEAFARWPGAIEVRFIEAMPFSRAARAHMTSGQVRAILGERFTLVPSGDEPGGPATVWTIVETGQRVGFISPLTEHFCHRCNRLRLEADGHLRTCLSRDDTPSLRGLLRSGADDGALERAIRAQVWDKVAGHEAHLDGGRSFEGVMTQIGG